MRFLFFLVSCFLSCIPTFGNNRSKGNEANKRYDSQSLLVLHKSLPTKTGRTHNAHSSHMAHASHASHYSGIVMTADSTANLTPKQIEFVKKVLYQIFKNNKKIEILRAYKSNKGSVHFAFSSSPLYEENNVIFLEFAINGIVYKYLIPRDKKISTFRIVTYHKEYTEHKYNWMNKIDEK